MIRAVRLVVDTGIHYKRWTREQAIAYMLDKTGLPESDVVSEVERYIVEPGTGLRLQGGHDRASARRASARGPRSDRASTPRR